MRCFSEFTLTYYPHRVASFRGLLEEAFDHRATVTTLGDFQPLELVQDPAFFIHVVHKPAATAESPSVSGSEEAWLGVSSSEESF